MKTWPPLWTLSTSSDEAEKRGYIRKVQESRRLNLLHVIDMEATTNESAFTLKVD